MTDWDRHPGVRTGRRLSPGERAADLVLRVAGTWRYLLVLAAVVVAAATAAVVGDRHAGAVAVLGLVLSAVALLEVSLVLMSGRHADRKGLEAALYDVDQGRRATAAAEDLRAEVQRLREEMARVVARADRRGF
ncbi:DUF1003 domain-containing protein [Actinoplanes sp. CA-142083]|uniref:DUF1003 domain-containing protein n=1 Tax=Actinoplanes sp. CA-142083 TaxID=3239903 RepID=UPI003D8D3228